MNKISWSAPEYEERERSADWFWALGVIVVTSTAASIIYSNYFLAVLLVLSGILLGFFARKKPEIITYELSEKGLKVGTRFYPHENTKSFWVEIETKPMLFIKSERFFMPIISIPIEYDMAEVIHQTFLTRNVIEEEMKEHPSEKIMEMLGF